MTRIPGLAIVGIIALGAAVAQSFGRFTFGVVLPAITTDLELSNTVAGSIGTVNVGAYLVGTLVVAAASARVRMLTMLRVGFVCSTVGLLLAAWTPNPWVLAVSMFAAGFGGACIWIPSPVIAASALRPDQRTLAVALLGSGIGLGVVFSGQVAGFVRSEQGDDAWRNVYVVHSVIAIAALALVMLFVRHRQDQLAASGGAGGFGALRRMRGWLPLTAAYTSFGFMYLLVLAFLTKRLEDDSGWSSGDASLAFTCLGVATVFGAPVFLTLSKRFGTRITMSTVFLMWAVFSALVLPGWYAPTLLSAAALGLLFSGMPSMITLYVVENTAAEDYGPSFAAATLAFSVAQMAAPQLGGVVADIFGSFLWVFVLSSFFALTGVIAALGLPRHRAPSTSEPVGRRPDLDLVFDVRAVDEVGSPTG